MPIDEDEWRRGMEASRRDPERSGTGPRQQVASFLRKHDDQGFTATEIAENVTLRSRGDAGGLKGRVKETVLSLGERKVLTYFLNQLVAEGHVETKILTDGGAETVYYRYRS